MGPSNLIYNTQVQSISQTTAAGQTTVNSSIIDMSGWEGVLYIVQLGTSTALAVITAQVQAGAANSAGSMANVGALLTITDVAAGTSNQVVLVEFYRPLSTQRYTRLQIGRTTQNSTILSAVAVQFKFKGSTSASGQVQGSTNIAGSAVVLGQ